MYENSRIMKKYKNYSQQFFTITYDPFNLMKRVLSTFFNVERQWKLHMVSLLTRIQRM